MNAPDKPACPPVPEDKQRPLATFQNSLRAWQARYRARLAAQAPVSGKAAEPTAPA